jgi:hypothetical protein
MRSTFDAIRTARTVACILAVAPLSFANGITVVDNPSLPVFTVLQAAVDAAPDGGLLLVQAGTYAGAVIDGKSLSIVANPGATPHTSSSLRVRNLTSAQTVFVSGMDIHGPSAGLIADSAGVILTNDAGAVRFESCTATGGRYDVSSSHATGGPGLLAQASSHVVLTGCHVRGGDAYVDLSGVGTPGGAGISSTNSNVVLYDCDVRGGVGALLGWPGGDGGNGCEISGWGMFASGSSIIGGMGGYGDDVGCSDGGIGGDGLHVTSAQVFLLDTPIYAGMGGYNGCSTAQTPGVQTVNVGGVVNQLAGTRRKLVAAALAPYATQLSITVTGQAGDRFYLMGSWTNALAYQHAWNGTWAIPPMTGAFTRAIVPPSGTLVMQVRLPDVAGLTHRLEYLQGFCLDASGQSTLTSPIQVEILGP